ncbi:MAG: DUF255 domain-containing protein, partial [Chitinophagaceae bacterium]|nr:DUF255 domain-containing protein [Chitinophagaceae bacterium]
MVLKILILIVSQLPIILFAQGIQWTNLSWEQVKQRAKEENKYIFLDVYATWCGPCKEMDKQVYINDSVGNFFNNQFISVKVQADQTTKDNDLIKNWYADAQAISKQYRVLSLPTFIFLSSEGNIVHKAIGFQNVEKFIAEATVALQPGKMYVDPYNEYDQLKADYHNGKKEYSRILYMIKSARDLGNEDFEKSLIQDYCRYLETLNDQKLYTKDNIEFLSGMEIKSNDKLFAVFYPDGRKADKAISKKGFSKRIVHRVILREIVEPFLQFKDDGPKPIRLDGKPTEPPDTSE